MSGEKNLQNLRRNERNRSRLKWFLPLTTAAVTAFTIGFLQSAVAPTTLEANADENPGKPDAVPKDAKDTKDAKDGASANANASAAHGEPVGAISDNPAEAATKRVLSKTYANCLTDEVALRDAKTARTELERMKRELDKREGELAAREKAVAEELAKLEVLQKDLKTAGNAIVAKDEEKIAKLVETFESMSPKAAAAILAPLDRKLAVAAMGRISPQKLGKILSAMPTNQSSALTEALAGVVPAKGGSDNYGAKEPSIGGSLTANAVKGGDNNANQQQQLKSNAIPGQTAPENGNPVGREPASQPQGSKQGRSPAR